MSRIKALIRRARLHYCSDVLTAEQNKRHQHKYVRSVVWLGDRWLLSKPMERRA